MRAGIEPVADWQLWLPEDAVRDHLGSGVLDAALRTWSIAWLQAVTLGLGTWTRGYPNQAKTAEAVVSKAAGIELLVEPTAIDRLALLMFGDPADASVITDADRRTLHAVARAGLGRLVDTVAEAFGATALLGAEALADHRSEEVWCAPIDDWSGASLAVLGVSERVVQGSLRRSLPPVAQQPPQPLAAALAMQPVTVSARIGGCALALSELAELAVGDVLVLDRDTGSRVAIAVDGEPKPGLDCLVARSADGFQLSF